MEMSLFLTARCNLNCIMCDIPRMSNKEDETPLLTIKRMIDDASEVGFNELSITGGEPLLRKDIFEIIRYASKKNIKTSLCTNGTLITNDIAKKLASSGLNSASISLEGPKQIHDKIRGKGTFDKVVRAIKLLKAENIYVNIATVIIKQNYSFLSKVVEIAHRLGISSIKFQPFTKSFLYNEKMGKKFILNLNEINKLKVEIKNAIRTSEHYNIEINPYEYLMKIPDYFLGKRMHPEKGCLVPSYSCAIDVSGNIHPCWPMFDIAIGNIKNNSFTNLWNSEKCYEIQQLSKNGNCSGCLLSCYDKSYKEKPLVASVKLTNLCNNNCLVCSILDKKASKNKSLSEIKKEIKQIRKQYSELIITGGEPTIMKDLIDIIKCAEGLDFYRITLRTNGRMFSFADYCKDVIKAGVDDFQIDLYGHTAQLHDKITRVPGSFEQTMQGIKNLVKLNQNVQINVLINEMNYKHLNDLVKLLNFLNISKVRFTFPEPSFQNKKIFHKLIPRIDEAVDLINQAKHSAEKLGMKMLPNEVTFRWSSKFENSLKMKPQLKFKYERYFNKKRVTVVIPTCNRKKLLRNTLISLFNQTCPKKDYEIIVVDDGSTDDTESMIKSLKPTCNLRYYYWPRYKKFVPGSPENRAGPARNIGITEADGDIIIFIDSDVICNPKLIEEHLKHQSKSSNLVVIGYRKELPEISSKPNFENIKDLDRKLCNDIRDIEYGQVADDLKNLDNYWSLFYSNNVSVRKQHLIDVGMFDENFVFWGVEDQEIGYKLFKKKLEFELDRDAVCYHQFHPTECKDFEDKVNALKNNGAVFYKKYLDIDIFHNYKFFIGYDCKSVKITDLCNNNCIVCHILDKKASKNKSLSEIKKELERIRKEYSELIITGGEPTVRKDLIDIIKCVKQLDFYHITLRTNGRMFSFADYCKDVIKAGVDDFQIDLYGHTAQLHDSVTQVSGSFNQTIQGIKNLVNLNKSVQVNVLITRMNYKELIKIIELLNKLRVSGVLFQTPDTSYGTRKNVYFNFKSFIPPYYDLGKKLSALVKYYHHHNLHEKMKLNITRI